MNPREFLDVADEWCVGNREAEWRSATSRAYFALFHAARILLERCGFNTPSGERAHAYVWLRLSNCGHRDLQRAGNSINRLRRFRNLADYNLTRPFTSSHAIDEVQVALKVMDLLEMAVTLPSILSKVTDAMRLYERDVLGEETWRL